MKELLRRLKNLKTWCSLGIHLWKLEEIEYEEDRIIIYLRCERNCGKIHVIGSKDKDD
jgi:hypothetical protein